MNLSYKIKITKYAIEWKTFSFKIDQEKTEQPYYFFLLSDNAIDNLCTWEERAFNLSFN